MKILLSLAAVAAALTASPAIAEPPAAGARIVVDYGDLDLSSRAGRAALDRRIRTAAQLACGTPSDADLHGKNVIRACRTQTIAEANLQRRTALANTATPGSASGQR